LLSGTLRTYQTAGCDHEYVQLSCPRGTTISIEFAQYGKTGDPALCPEMTEETQRDGVINSGTEIEIKAPVSCMWPQVLQYALLQTVVESCQKKRHCKFLSSPKTFKGDPCPGFRKFIEVAYKCRPYEFRSKVACENDVTQLICNPYSRIAVYSASYGRTEYESLQCSQPQGVKEETCLASYATETVMQKCHGLRKCTLSADQNTFGKPCRPESRMYLKVVYTCVPRKVLIDRYESTPEADEPLQSDLEQDQVDLYDDDQFYKESDLIPPGPAPKLQGDLVKKQQRPQDGPIYTYTSSISPPLRARDESTLEENQEKFYLYLIISVTAGVVLCLMIVITRLILNRRRNDGNSENGKNPGGHFKNSNTGETTITNGFSADDISEIDADIDLTTPLPMPSVSRNDNYNSYTPSPSPYGNLGPSNISHTSSTLLMPQSSMSSHCSTGPPSIMSGSINPSMMMPQTTMATSFANMPSLGGTLPRQQHHPVSISGLSIIPPPTFLSGSVMGHHTLRRQSSHDMDHQMPRILSRNAANVQYYYG
ncbi:unnamed protein product, partial [Diamesa tonsa]